MLASWLFPAYDCYIVGKLEIPSFLKAVFLSYGYGFIVAVMRVRPNVVLFQLKVITRHRSRHLRCFITVRPSAHWVPTPPVRVDERDSPQPATQRP